MKFNVIPSDRFKKEAKRLIKKYPSLKAELLELSTLLSDTPDAGTSLGFNAYKIRIAIRSKKTGKSGGARIITYVITQNAEVYLLTIYDKSQFDSIDDKTLRKIISTLDIEG